jgi:hypothetical protein
MARALLAAFRTASWTRDPARLRTLAELARRLPPLAETHQVDALLALAGPSGPYAAAGCREWTVFQPLTVPLDEVVKRYLR